MRERKMPYTIQNSHAFANLTSAAKTAINKVPDSVQFLAACAANGGMTYGRSSSQAVESQNSHLKSARSLDPFTSVLFVCEMEEQRFLKHQLGVKVLLEEESLKIQDWLPPAIRKRLAELKPVGSVTYSRAQSNADEIRYGFTVKTTGGVYRVTLNVILYDVGSHSPGTIGYEDGDIISAFGECSCGCQSATNFLALTWLLPRGSGIIPTSLSFHNYSKHRHGGSRTGRILILLFLLLKGSLPGPHQTLVVEMVLLHFR